MLAANPLALALAALADLALGDPAYRWHPIRLMGRSLAAVERALRAHGAHGYGGGIALFVVLALAWVTGASALVRLAEQIAPGLGWLVHGFLVYSFLALGDLIRHVWRVELALVRADVGGARAAIAQLVGRDTDAMDAAACRRAAIESLSENLADGVVSPVFWYALGGVPALVLFKVVSTMDSMVGYKTPRYREFGWCGARLDDVMNYVPARLTWLLMAAIAAVLPRYSGRKSFAIGLQQHAVLPGPNSGWSEAAAAGAIERKLAGPIWMEGRLVTDIWIGDAADPPAESRDDVRRAIVLAAATGVTAIAVVVVILL